MKIKLLRDAKVLHKPGEVVDTSPDYANILLKNGMAIPFVEEKVEEKEKEVKPKKSTKKK